VGAFATCRTYAQEAQAPAAESDKIEEVTVTGTRIRRPEFEAPTPVTSLSAEQLLAANPGGPVDALRQLPVLAFSTGPRGATGSAGQGGSFLNLRNLGANRTLVLLDGKRLIFLSKTFGDVFEIELATGIIRPVTQHYFHNGYTRALYLANGNILLSGAREFNQQNPWVSRTDTAELS